MNWKTISTKVARWTAVCAAILVILLAILFGLAQTQLGKRLVAKQVAKGTKKRGIGMSCLVHGSGGRFDIPDPASATVMFNADGSVNLITAATDDGQA